MSEHIRFFGDHRAALGESPVWDGDRLWWVDAVAGRIHCAAADGTPLERWAYDRPVGSIGLARDGLVAALADGFHHIARDGRATPLWRAPVDAALRFNDGKMDRAGQFLSGQLEQQAAPTPAAALWRLGRDGTASMLADGLRLTNAICFSPGGDTICFADSLEGVLRLHAYDPHGAIGARVGAIDCRPHGSGPDGATIDSDGNIWVALVLAQAIACFAPDGRLLRRIALPIPYPSCPAFGGPDMATLFVTTIADSGHRLKSDHPDAGRILAIEGLGATGIAEARWQSHP